MLEDIVTSDYIVVGAGSAGSVITRRLIDQGFAVHVIEAGTVDGDPRIHSAHGWPALAEHVEGMAHHHDTTATCRES